MPCCETIFRHLLFRLMCWHRFDKLLVLAKGRICYFGVGLDVASVVPVDLQYKYLFGHIRRVILYEDD